MADACDIAVVGGGAAGLAGAIFAAEAVREGGQERTSASVVQPRIVVLDGAARIGAKILVSGGGRCNVTHEAVRPEDFQGPRNVVRNVLRHFDEAATVRWFEAMGVMLKLEATGKLFPVSDDAHTVVNALLRRCSELSIEIRTSHRVGDVTREGDALAVHVGDERLVASRVIFATGGRSLPRTGSDGGGWAILQRLGHTVTATHPALVPLVLDESFFHASLSGTALDIELSTFVADKLVDRRRGSLLWTHFGCSGPVVMDASRFWTIAHESGRPVELRCALLPGESFESLERWLIDAAAREPRRTVVSVLTDRLSRRVAEAIVRHLELDLPMGQLPRDSRRSLVHALTALPLPVVRDRGWNYAEVTAGGVPLSEIDHRTMASRIVPGLHLAGEVLDCDGRIGGFNFQWAWATGYIAGRAAAAGLHR